VIHYEKIAQKKAKRQNHSSNERRREWQIDKGQG
jgi:hypothetical protein